MHISPASFVDVRDTTLHYRCHRASGTSPATLLLVHGFGASGETWNDIIPFLDSHCDLVRVDLKGFGFSAKPRGSSYALHEQAELVADFVSILPAKNIILIGHSYGGAVTFMAYLKLRDKKLVSRIKGLVLIDSASYVQQPPSFIARLRNPVMRYCIRVLTTPEWRTRYVLRTVFADKNRVDEDRIERHAYFLRLPGADHALARAAIELVPPDAAQLISLLKTTDLPTQILWGALDPVIPVDRAYQLNKDIPNSELTILPGCGHVPHEERPGATAAIVLRFIERLQLCS